MTTGLFDDIVSFPDPDMHDRYQALVGLDERRSGLRKRPRPCCAPTC